MDAPETATNTEKLKVLFHQLPLALAINVLISILFVAALWTPARAGGFVAWGAAQGCVIGFRLWLLQAYRRTRRDNSDSAFWRQAFVVGAGCSGALWGSTVVWLDPSDPLTLVMITFVIGGMAAGALTTLSSYLPAFLLYLLPSVLPLAGALMIQGKDVHVAMGGMVIVYGCGLAMIASRFDRTLTRMLQLAADKQQLLDQMEQQVRDRTAELERANASLQAEVSERMRAQAEAERANLAKSRFLAAASHDLRQPLQSMMLFGALLQRYVEQPPAANALDMLRRGLDTLTGLLDSLLDLSRLDVNVTTPEFGLVPLRPLLQDIATAYQPVAATRGLALGLDAMDDVMVYSDRTLLGRMIRNLLENAIRYTDEGEVRLRCHRHGNRAHIQVRDTGVGIPAEQIERVFEEFQRNVAPQHAQERGLGLGLAIVQRLSAILDHPVTVESQPGKGSTFEISVPLAAVNAAAAMAAVSLSARPGQGRTIVLIEDDDLVLMGLQSLLQDWGYRTIAAPSAEQALHALQSESAPPSAIIVDYRLRSGETGTQAVTLVRDLFATPVPAIILTGETSGEADSAAAALHLTALRKPLAPEELARALEAA